MWNLIFRLVNKENYGIRTGIWVAQEITVHRTKIENDSRVSIYCQMKRKGGRFEGINITSLLFMIQSFSVSHKTLGISHIIKKINCINWPKIPLFKRKI